MLIYPPSDHRFLFSFLFFSFFFFLFIKSRYGKTPAQIVLRWHIERGCSAVPKSVTPERIADNIKVFDFSLTAEDMAKFHRLNRGW